MDTANDTSPLLLTIAQELSQLISTIASKELDFFTDNRIKVLHDLRVDLRKLRTWLNIMATAGFPVKKLHNSCVRCHNLGSELRNFDVLIHWIKENPLLVSAKLQHTLKLKRKKLKKQFLKELIDKNSLQQLRVLGRSLLPHLKGINKSYFELQVQLYIHKKREAFNHILPQIDKNAKHLHTIRKILKKVRYALELLPTIKVQHQNEIKYLQDILGYINDRRVWIDLLQSHIKNTQETSALEDVFRADIQMKIEEFKEYINRHEVSF